MVAHSKLWYVERFRLLEIVGELAVVDESPRGHLARETVDAVLQDFRQRGLVDAARRSIRIADPSRLRLVS